MVFLSTADLSKKRLPLTSLYMSAKQEFQDKGCNKSLTLELNRCVNGEFNGYPRNPNKTN